MALNQVIYLPNPAASQSKTVGTILTATGAGATTLATITAATQVRVRNFTICLSCVGDGISDYICGILKIGTGQFAVSVATPASVAYIAQFSSADLGFDGAWLQPTDTITFQAVEAGGGTLTSIRASVSVSLEEFTA